MEKILKNKNIKIISLGSNCYNKIYLNKIGIKRETNYFDYIGTSMWAINELFIMNKFKDVFSNKDNFINMEILTTKENRYIITNKQYYLRFKHEFNKNNIDTYEKIKNSYERKYQRLFQYLTTLKNILFIRYEEEHHNRIIYKEYSEKYKHDELHYLKELSLYFKKTFPSLNFNIIFLTSNITDNKYLEDYNIMILYVENKSNIKWYNSHNDLKNIFNDNGDFIEKYIFNDIEMDLDTNFLSQEDISHKDPYDNIYKDPYEQGYGYNDIF